jgi:hypothetical protein
VNAGAFYDHAFPEINLETCTGGSLSTFHVADSAFLANKAVGIRSWYC